MLTYSLTMKIECQCSYWLHRHNNNHMDIDGKFWRPLTDLEGTISWTEVLGCAYIYCTIVTFRKYENGGCSCWLHRLFYFVIEYLREKIKKIHQTPPSQLLLDGLGLKLLFLSEPTHQAILVCCSEPTDITTVYVQSDNYILYRAAMWTASSCTEDGWRVVCCGGVMMARRPAAPGAAVASVSGPPSTGSSSAQWRRPGWAGRGWSRYPCIPGTINQQYR